MFPPAGIVAGARHFAAASRGRHRRPKGASNPPKIPPVILSIFFVLYLHQTFERNPTQIGSEINLDKRTFSTEFKG